MTIVPRAHRGTRIAEQSPEKWRVKATVQRQNNKKNKLSLFTIQDKICRIKRDRVSAIKIEQRKNSGITMAT